MRLDNYLVECGYFDSRTKARQAIDRGEIFVNGKLNTKAAYNVEENLEQKIEYVYENSFVSLGGFKIFKALTEFDFCVKDFVVADVGASTGGFTDCLLKNGARKVYAVDLNDKLLHPTLLNCDKVVPIIKNAKQLTLNDFNDQLDLLVSDLSFISATYVMDVFSSLLTSGKFAILLVKPQFELDERKKFKNGIIRDSKIQNAALEKVLSCAKENGFIHLKTTTAPELKDKNLEYLVLLKKI